MEHFAYEYRMCFVVLFVRGNVFNKKPVTNESKPFQGLQALERVQLRKLSNKFIPDQNGPAIHAARFTFNFSSYDVIGEFSEKALIAFN